MRDDQKARLNDELRPEEFEICVPIDCRLLGRWDTKEAWREYLRELTGGHELSKELEDSTPLCWSCEGRLGWKLTGEWAVLHASRVHDKIFRQALGLDQVTAIDVGFAISERQTKFYNHLSIRIHVNRKMPPEQLVSAGMFSLTEPLFAPFFRDIEGQLPKGLSWSGVAALVASDSKSYVERLFKLTEGDERSHSSASNWPKLPPPEMRERLMRLFMKDLRYRREYLRSLYSGRYPISGVQLDDLSVYCSKLMSEIRSLDEVRLCICGVPIDIVNAQYNPAVMHPGGDAESGVFADPPKGSVELEDDELALMGRGRINPLVGGVSVGTATGQTGTLGTIVWDRTDGSACGLSNWHVLAGGTGVQIGQPTYQPALFDGGTQEDVVGHLKRWHFGEDGDAALTELTGSRHYASGEILGLWHPISGYLEPKLNMEIRKWGRTTGFTQGFVDGIHMATNIDYGNGVVRSFRRQFHVAPLYVSEDVSRSGDSGSLIVTSLKPFELQKDLETLARWLRRFCESQSYEPFYNGIIRTLGACMQNLLERALARKRSSEAVDLEETSGGATGILEETLQFLRSSDPLDWTLSEEFVGRLFPSQRSQLLADEGGRDLGRLLSEVFRDLNNIRDQTPVERRSGDNCYFGEGSQDGISSGKGCPLPTHECFERDMFVLPGLERRFCFSCYLKSRREEVRKIREEYKGVLREFERFGMRMKPFLATSRDGLLTISRAKGLLAAVPEKLGWEQVSSKINSFNCYDELENLYRELSRGEGLAKERVNICDEVEEYLTTWQGQFHSIQTAVRESKRLSAEFSRYADDPRAKKPAWVAKRFEEAGLEFAKGEALDRSPPQSTKKSQEKKWMYDGFVGPRQEIKSPLVRKYQEEFKELGFDTERQGEGSWFRQLLQSEARDYVNTPTSKDEHWFRLLQREDLRVSVGFDPLNTEWDWFEQLLIKNLSRAEIRSAILRKAKEHLKAQADKALRETNRTYYAVGLIFAGDTPGSPFGEFAVASDIQRLAKKLRFSLRPVFEPRSSFRELRVRPSRRQRGPGREAGGLGGIAPGGQGSDPRGGGPQPDPEPLNTNPGDRPADNSDG